jgi:transposase
MISFNRLTKIFVCREATDMRSSYDGLFEKTKRILQKDPFSGYLFIFMNKKRTSVKCLFYDGTGLVLICKRLERSAFSMLNPYYPGEIELSAAEFGLFFEGANFSKRFIESPSEIKKSIKNFPVSQSLQSNSV